MIIIWQILIPLSFLWLRWHWLQVWHSGSHGWGQWVEQRIGGTGGQEGRGTAAGAGVGGSMSFPQQPVRAIPPVLLLLPPPLHHTIYLHRYVSVHPMVVLVGLDAPNYTHFFIVNYTQSISVFLSTKSIVRQVHYYNGHQIHTPNKYNSLMSHIHSSVSFIQTAAMQLSTYIHTLLLKCICICRCIYAALCPPGGGAAGEGFGSLVLH